MLICDQVKRLIDEHKEGDFLRFGRGCSKSLLTLQLNILAYLRGKGFSWKQIEKNSGILLY